MTLHYDGDNEVVVCAASARGDPQIGGKVWAIARAIQTIGEV